MDYQQSGASCRKLGKAAEIVSQIYCYDSRQSNLFKQSVIVVAESELPQLYDQFSRTKKKIANETPFFSAYLSKNQSI